jgi:alkylmercury lyase-like protein
MMESMRFETQVKVAIYSHFAETGEAPLLEEIARCCGSDAARVRDAYGRLREERVLVLEPDGCSIRMAPPFSGVPTQHRVSAGGKEYFANCAWDALGVPAALHLPAEVRSRCEQSGEPLRLEIGPEGPEPSDWLFHCLVPAAKWWEDIVFT